MVRYPDREGGDERTGKGRGTSDRGTTIGSFAYTRRPGAVTILGTNHERG